MKVTINHSWLFSNIIKIIPKVIIITYVLNIILKLVFKLPHPPWEYNDFLQNWVASSFVLAGKPAVVYDLAQFYRALSHIAGPGLNTPWFYPPIFLLLVSPFSLVPYYVALASWLALTLGGYLAVVRRIAPHPLTLWLALAFPGALMNLDYGQNGLFSAALFGGGLLLLEPYPFLAGIIFGVLVYKPNFFILIPLALIAGRYWRTLGATIISAGVLTLASGLVLGWETWTAFWHIHNVPMQALAQGIASLGKMPTIFAATLMAGGGLTAAYCLQGIVMAVSAGAVIWAWWKMCQKTDMAIRVSVLTLGSLLFTPYGSEYELVRLAIPLAWIGWAGYQRGWTRGDKIFLILGWITPFISRFLAEGSVVQITPLILLVLLYLNLTALPLSKPPVMPTQSL
jgi:alpha-1,2-mannosyltransferase